MGLEIAVDDLLVAQELKTLDHIQEHSHAPAEVNRALLLVQDVVERATWQVLSNDRDVRRDRAHAHELHNIGAADLAQPLELLVEVLELVLVHLLLRFEDFHRNVLTKVRPAVHNACGTGTDALV